MRHSYPLSEATIKVLTNRTECIAQEMDIDATNLRQVLNGTATDCFAKFRHLFAAAVRAEAPVHHWLVELETIQARYAPIPAAEKPGVLTGDIGREYSEFVEVEVQDEPFERQITECGDIIRAATKKKNDLIAAKNKAAFSNGHIRHTIADAVAEHRSKR